MLDADAEERAVTADLQAVQAQIASNAAKECLSRRIGEL